MMVKADDQPFRLLAEIGDMGDRTGGFFDQRQKIVIGFGAAMMTPAGFCIRKDFS